jgi:hypothetical protein
MSLSGCLLVVSAAVPLVAAGLANRSTSLFHAIAWSWLALVAWGVAVGTGRQGSSYLALVLIGCAGIAVLGARRPGVVAWNFVVLGLLVVLLLPVAEAAILGTPMRLGAFRTAFLTVLLGVTVVNYLPTRLAFGAVLLGVGCALELHRLLSGWADTPVELWGLPFSAWCVGLAPGAAWLGLRVRRRAETPVDRLWREFRDSFGLVWGLRLQEQFNRAAANVGLNAELSWWGLRSSNGARPEAGPGSAAYETLVALMKRFGLPNAVSSRPE